MHGVLCNGSIVTVPKGTLTPDWIQTLGSQELLGDIGGLGRRRGEPRTAKTPLLSYSKGSHQISVLKIAEWETGVT